MAFAFFRKRQKMVVIIMAVLMVSFLIGFQGFNMLFAPKPAERKVGMSSAGDLQIGQVWAADKDIKMLEFLGVGDVRRLAQFQIWPTDLEYLTLIYSPNSQAELTYALLLQEVQTQEVDISKDDIDKFFARIGLAGASYEAKISQLTSVHKKSESYIRGVVARWLAVNKAYATSQVDAPASEPQLKHLFHDLNEKIGLRVLTVSAEDYLEGVAEPTEEEIAIQFGTFRNVIPGTVTNVASFGFGYMQPSRVKIDYLLIKKVPVERIAVPSSEEIRRYYRKNKEEFVKKIPIEPAKPADEEDQPETQPTEYRTEQMTFTEAKSQIIEKLTAEAVSSVLDMLSGRVEALLQEYPEKGIESGLGAYKWTNSQMRIGAEEILARKIIGEIDIDKKPLREAVAVLAKAAGLDAICFPWGKQDKDELSAEVRVTLKAADLTLAEALEKISQQVKQPNIKWARCRGLEGVLFPDDFSIDGLFPIYFYSTQLVDANELAGDAVLGQSYSSANMPLARVAFSAAELVQNTGRSSIMKKGEDGMRMQVSGDNAGMLQWRLVDAVAVHAPESMNDEIRLQVVEDLKIKSAFELARKKADELLVDARQTSLEDAAKQANLETFTTGEFSRKAVVAPWQQPYYMALYSGRSPAEAMLIRLLSKPIDFAIAQVEKVEIPWQVLQEEFVNTAFSLVPEDVEPPYDDEKSPVVAISLPAKKEVLVLQREAFSPAVIGEFESQRLDMISALNQIRSWQIRKEWFGYENIKRRLGFQLLMAEK